MLVVITINSWSFIVFRLFQNDFWRDPARDLKWNICQISSPALPYRKIIVRKTTIEIVIFTLIFLYKRVGYLIYVSPQLSSKILLIHYWCCFSKSLAVPYNKFDNMTLFKMKTIFESALAHDSSVFKCLNHVNNWLL